MGKKNGAGNATPKEISSVDLKEAAASLLDYLKGERVKVDAAVVKQLQKNFETWKTRTTTLDPDRTRWVNYLKCIADGKQYHTDKVPLRIAKLIEKEADELVAESEAMTMA